MKQPVLLQASGFASFIKKKRHFKDDHEPASLNGRLTRAGKNKN